MANYNDKKKRPPVRPGVDPFDIVKNQGLEDPRNRLFSNKPGPSPAPRPTPGTGMVPPVDPGTRGGGRDVPGPVGPNTQVGPGYNAPNIHGGYPNPYANDMLTDPQSIAEFQYGGYYDWLNETGTEHTGWESWNEFIGSEDSIFFGQMSADNWSEYLTSAGQTLEAHGNQYGQDHGWNHGGTSTGPAGQASQSSGGNIGGYGDLGNWSSGGSMWGEAWDDISNQPTQTEIPDDMNCYNQYASAQGAGYGGTFNEFASLYCGG